MNGVRSIIVAEEWEGAGEIIPLYEPTHTEIPGGLTAMPQYARVFGSRALAKRHAKKIRDMYPNAKVVPEVRQ